MTGRRIRQECRCILARHLVAIGDRAGAQDRLAMWLKGVQSMRRLSQNPGLRRKTEAKAKACDILTTFLYPAEGSPV